MGNGSHLSKLAAQWFGIDLRSLAAIRICLGFLLLADLCLRVGDVEAFYTDHGLLPRGPLLERLQPSRWMLSLHVAGGEAGFQYALFLLAAGFAAALLLGYRTPLAAFGSWVLLISLHSRNSMILHGGDVFLRVLLFWAMFLPLGEKWSLDALLRPPDAGMARKTILSVRTFCLLMQVCFIFWFTAALKTGFTWYEGTAIYYALNYDILTTAFGTWLLNFPELLAFLTRTTLLLEWFGPFLLFLPFCNTLARYVVIAAFISFHIGTALTLELSLFPWVCCTAWLAFLPPVFWDKHLPAILRLAGWTAERAAPLLDRFRGRMLRLARWLPAHAPASGPPPPWRNFLTAAFLLVCLGYVFMWNLRALDFRKYQAIFPPSANGYGYLLRLDQYWDMFAANPSREDGWYVIPGKLRDGTEVDLFTAGGPVRWDKPRDVSASFKNQRWRKYMMNLAMRANSAHRLHYGRYLCRWWNATHRYGATLETFEICYMMELTPPPGEKAVPRRTSLWTHRCSGTAAPAATTLPRGTNAVPKAPVRPATPTNAPALRPPPMRPVLPGTTNAPSQPATTPPVTSAGKEAPPEACCGE